MQNTGRGTYKIRAEQKYYILLIASNLLYWALLSVCVYVATRVILNRWRIAIVKASR